jgi:hypothetical protein
MYPSRFPSLNIYCLPFLHKRSVLWTYCSQHIMCTANMPCSPRSCIEIFLLLLFLLLLAVSNLCGCSIVYSHIKEDTSQSFAKTNILQRLILCVCLIVVWAVWDRFLEERFLTQRGQSCIIF